MHLTPKDRAHLEAAEGWLDLENHAESKRELDEIAVEHHSHPDVLQVRWSLLAHEGRWELCLAAAEAITCQAPERPIGWLHKAVSLDHLGRTREAIEVLEGCVERFDPNATFPYYLATFCTKSGDVATAEFWLALAFERAKNKDEMKRIRLKMLNDAALRALWERISTAN